MTEKLDRVPVRRQIGSEPFTDGEDSLGFDLLGFWEWSASDLVSNTARGVLAEYLVARALGIDVSGVRDSWAAYDLRTPSGIKVEVKSAAYLQSWHQDRPSVVSFRTPKTRAWDPDTNRLDAEAKRRLGLRHHASEFRVSFDANLNQVSGTELRNFGTELRTAAPHRFSWARSGD
jgi:hypothetical protein